MSTVILQLGAPKGGALVSVIDGKPIRFVSGDKRELFRVDDWATALDATNRLVGRGYWIEPR